MVLLRFTSTVLSINRSPPWCWGAAVTNYVIYFFNPNSFTLYARYTYVVMESHWNDKLIANIDPELKAVIPSRKVSGQFQLWLQGIAQ